MKNILLLAMPLLLAGAPPAAELPGHANVSTTVRYDDLNLSSAEGKAQLERRLSRAVRSLCRPSGRLTLAEAEAVNDCMASANQNAKQSLEFAVEGTRSRSIDVADAGSVMALERP